jgi:hypothetical protein
LSIISIIYKNKNNTKTILRRLLKMANFSYNQYQQVVEQAQANGEGSAKIGYFKLKNDGDIAIARINISSTDDMMFASVHTMNVGGRWMKVSCLNPLGVNGGQCALCSAHTANPNGSVGKSAKKLFIPMMVSYRDPNAETGYTAPIPVIWDRPAAFSRELANKLMVAGDLRNTMVLITRNGKAGDMQTTYSMDILPETHPVFKPSMVPADFSAFNNFNIAKHSYWEKSADEINTFLTTGQFPERVQTNAQQATATVATVANTYAQPATTGGYVANTTTANAGYVTPTAPARTPATAPQTPPVTTFNQPAAYTPPAQSATTANPTPSRNFTGFSF